MKMLCTLLLAVFLVACASDQKTARTSTQTEASVHFKPSLLFDVNEDKIKNDAILDVNARWLKARPDKVMILEGHCDERGDREFNLHLGDRRARAVAKALMARGVPEKQLIIVSYGKDKPVVNCRTGQDENRQVRFIVR